MIPDLVTPPLALLLWALAGYLLGSIPFGVVLARAFGLGDLRRVGSGNIGATNVLRTGNKTAAALTLVLDGGKGAAAVLIARALAAEDAVQLAGFAAFLGHCFPVWLGFKGGKGVATNAGVAFGLAWPLGLAYAFVWLSILAIFRISSLAGMAAVVAAAAAAPLFGYPQFFPVLAAIALLIIYLHRANIARLAKGEEPRVGGSKDGAGG